MKPRFWPEDTLARRFATTIVLAIVVALVPALAAVRLGGVWGQPPIGEIGLLERANDIVRLVEAAREQERPALMDAVTNAIFRADWYPARSVVSVMLDAAWDRRAATSRMTDHADDWRYMQAFKSNGQQRPVVNFSSEMREYPREKLHAGSPDGANPYFLALRLADGSWIVFTAPHRVWGIKRQTRIGIAVALLILSTMAASAIATYQLGRPIRRFTEAVRRFGTDPRAAPIPETGPRELRMTIVAFNAMQGQIQKFVEDRKAMLAAISHDLRTPLTKIRLRGEFVEDEEQRSRLFQDVADMQAMVDSTLAFSRDDFQDEATTTFDFAEMLRTIADDYGDQGTEILYDGPEHVAFQGRPFALKRAFTNLVDNAVKYGRAPELHFSTSEQRIVVQVKDSGPGIPAGAEEQVFAPFYRLERSRNRATGGVGLGLTSARAVIRAHGGEIHVRNRPTAGLEVEVALPVLR
ncbi:MAG TPA: ATP-binding protein [Rhodopila sp.]